jgi:hypothetical protein
MISLHVEVCKDSEKFTIKAHLDLGIHGDITCNTLTLSLLSELAYFLERVVPNTKTITHTKNKDLETQEEISSLVKTELLMEEVPTIPREDLKYKQQLEILKKPIKSSSLKIKQRVSKKKRTKVHEVKPKLKSRRAKKETDALQKTLLEANIEEIGEVFHSPILDHEEIHELITNGRKLEEERINKEIIPFIRAFRISEFGRIYQLQIQSKDFFVSKENIKQRVRTSYKDKIKGMTSLNKECYPIKFEEYISEEFDDDFNTLTRRLEELSPKKKPSFISQFKDWVMNCKGDVLILFVVIGLVMIIYSIIQWMMAMPMLEFFEFFNNNLWIVFLISFLIFITIVFAILFVNGVMSYIED